MQRFITAAALLACIGGAATRADAQSDSLSNLIPSKIFSSIRLDPSPTTVAHTAHFDILNQQYGTLRGGPLEIYTAQRNLAESLNRQIGSELSTFPLGASAGGFSFTLDPTLGTFSRSTDSFGPLFSQRAYTVGRGRLSLGMNYLFRTYDSYEGRSLHDAEIKFYFPHNDCCPGQSTTGAAGGDGSLLNPFFEGDIIEANLGLNMDSTTVSLFANYGITDHFDLGVAVPINNVDMKTDLRLRILRLATTTNSTVHSFDGAGLDTETLNENGSATGIGDIAIRGKMRFLDRPGGGLAVSADLRLPTGDELNLLGTGATQFTLTFIGSAQAGRFAPHVNVGYTFSGGVSDEAEENFVGAPPDEFDYTFGADIAVKPRFTIAADFIGRTLIDTRRLVDTNLDFHYKTSADGAEQVSTLPAFTTEPGNLTLLLGSAGFKMNLTKTLLFSASVLFPLNDAGLRDAITPVFGLDYTFGK